MRALLNGLKAAALAVVLILAPPAMAQEVPAPAPATASPPLESPAPAIPKDKPREAAKAAQPLDSAVATALKDTPQESTKTAEAIRIALILSLLTLIPALLICMTPFIRIIVVLSMIRHAFGMPETPPNQVLISLALFLTAFAMMPALTTINHDALQPFMKGTITVEQAMDKGSGPLRAFMLRQVHDQDLKTVYEIAKQPLPAKASEVGMLQLTSAFMLNELRVSFKIGFVILLPFLLIDLVVSSILLSLGMLMVPPSTLSLPIKVLMFVLIDGWSLVLQGVLGSFH